MVTKRGHLLLSFIFISRDSELAKCVSHWILVIPFLKEERCHPRILKRNQLMLKSIYLEGQGLVQANHKTWLYTSIKEIYHPRYEMHAIFNHRTWLCIPKWNCTIHGSIRYKIVSQASSLYHKWIRHIWNIDWIHYEFVDVFQGSKEAQESIKKRSVRLVSQIYFHL